MGDDYWIDGQIEILKNWEELWEKYEIQVKTWDSFKIEKWGKIKIRPISRNDLKYWNKDTNFPVFIVAVEASSQKCYWIDIREYYEKLKKEKTQKNIIIYAKSTNELNESNKNSFLDFLQEYKIFTSKRILKDSSIYEKIKSVSEEKGYICILNSSKTNSSTLKPIFNFSDWNNSIWLLETEESKKHPLISRFQINKEIWTGMFELSNFSLDLGSENIFFSELGKLEITEISDKIWLSIVTKNYRKNLIANREYKNKKTSITWTLEELLYLSISIEDIKAQVSLKINYINCKSVQEIEDLQNFWKELWNGFEILIQLNNQEISLTKWSMNVHESLSHQIVIKYIHLLSTIERKFGINFDVTTVVKNADNYNKDDMLRAYIESLAEWNKMLKNAKITWDFVEKNKQSLNWEKVFNIEQIGITLLGILIKNVKINFTGLWTITKRWKSVEISSPEMMLTTKLIKI